MSEIDWVDKMETNQIQSIPDNKFVSYLEWEEPNKLDKIFAIGLIVAIVVCITTIASIMFDM